MNETRLPVTISKAGRPAVDARSLLEVMTEDFHCGCEVELRVAEESLPAAYSVADAERALEALCALVASRQPAQQPFGSAAAQPSEGKRG